MGWCCVRASTCANTQKRTRESSPQRGAETEFKPARARSSAPEHICDGLVRAELPNSAGADLLYANWLFFAGTRRTDVKAPRCSRARSC